MFSFSSFVCLFDFMNNFIVVSDLLKFSSLLFMFVYVKSVLIS